MSESQALIVGSANPTPVEVQARHLTDVSFKYTWKIENYLKIVEQGLSVDSPPFRVRF